VEEVIDRVIEKPIRANLRRASVNTGGAEKSKNFENREAKKLKKS
jgi:hypothetical protein